MCFVPVSGLTGENIFFKSPRTPWYEGPPLLRAISEAKGWTPKIPCSSRPLRVPILRVFRKTGVGLIGFGVVRHGTLKIGSKLVILGKLHRSPTTCTVQSIWLNEKPVDEAEAGSPVTFLLKGVTYADENALESCLHRGDMMSDPLASPQLCTEIKAAVPNPSTIFSNFESFPLFTLIC